jgi:hypothetical protein
MSEAQPAAQATPAATETVTPAAAQTAAESTVAVQNGRTVGENPAPLRARTVGSAMERARAALEARAAAAKPIVAKTAETPKASEAAKPGEAAAPKPAPVAEVKPPEPTAETKAKEAEKQQRLSRTLAIIEEREQRALATEKRAKAAMAEMQAKQASTSENPAVKLAQQLLDVKQKEGPAGVLKLLGIDLRAGVEELAKTYEEPTHEDIARKAARLELEAFHKAERERIEREKSEKEQAESAKVQVQRAEYVPDVIAEFSRCADDFPFVISNEVTADQIFNYAKAVEQQTGKRPSAIEALRAIEDMLEKPNAAAYEKKQARRKAAEEAEKKAAPADPQPTIPPKAEAKLDQAKQDKDPAEPRSRKESEIKPRPLRVSKNASAIERARQAMANRNLS